MQLDSVNGGLIEATGDVTSQREAFGQGTGGTKLEEAPITVRSTIGHLDGTKLSLRKLVEDGFSKWCFWAMIE